MNLIKRYSLHVLRIRDFLSEKCTINICVFTRHGLKLTILFKSGRLKVNFDLNICSKFAHNALFLCESRETEFCLRGHYKYSYPSYKPSRTKT